MSGQLPTPLRRLIVAHGYNASPSKHWFPWLQSSLPSVDVIVPALPNSTDPDRSEWLAELTATIEQPDPDTVIVGHSLGCITTLLALDAIPGEWQLGGLILVAGFDDNLPNLPQLNPFTAEPSYNPQKIISRTRFRSAIYSDNDGIVNPRFSRRLAQRLRCEEIEVVGGCHFLDREGVTELPSVLQQLERLVENIPGETAQH